MSHNSAKTGLQQLTLLQELLGAEKGKSSAVRDICIRGTVDLVLFLNTTRRQYLLLHFIQVSSEVDSKSFCDFSKSKTESMTAS